MANTGVNSLSLTVAGACITNGSANATFGEAPISSANSAPITITDSTTSESVQPTLATFVVNTNTIQALDWYAQLEATNANINTLANNLVTSWNTMFDGEGEEIFSAGFDLFSGNALATTGNLTVGTTDQVLDYALTWGSDTLGGSIVAGNIIGDPRKFGTIVSTCNSYVDNVNELIAGANNIDTNLNTVTFQSVGGTITGELELVNKDLADFGTDLASTGNLINFARLQYLGYPGQLCANLISAGGLGILEAKLQNITVSRRLAQIIGVPFTRDITLAYQQVQVLTVKQLGLNIQELLQQGGSLPNEFQKSIYRVLDGLTTVEVNQLKTILGITTSTIVSGPDLLDPKKIFPNCFDTFTITLSAGTRLHRSFAIYMDNQGTINNTVSQQLDPQLKNIIPSDIAIANDALQRSLRQVKNIENSTSNELSTTIANLESTVLLTEIENQSEYLPSTVSTYWTSTYQNSGNITLASGNGNLFTISDVIGFAAGYNSAAPLQQNANLLATMQTAGDLDSLYADNGSSSSSTGIYPVIDYLIDGTYGASTTITIPAGVYGAGTYTGSDFDDAVGNCWTNGIIPAAQSLASTLYSATTNAQIVQRNHRRVQEQLAREKINRDRIDIDTTEIRASDDVAVNFANNIQFYGRTLLAGSVRELLERVVDFNSLGGQAIIALMRQGQNVEVLETATINEDIDLEVDFPQDDAVVTQNQTSAVQARAGLNFN